MKVVSKTALANLKQNKGRNILTGIATVLTIILIYTILSIGLGSIRVQMEAIKEIYPTWHLMYHNVTGEQLEALGKHAAIEEIGTSVDIAQSEIYDTKFIFVYLDEIGCRMSKLELLEGSMPKKANEIAISKASLGILGRAGNVGDYIELPFQLYTAEGLTSVRTENFRITAILPDASSNREKATQGIMVSQVFLQEQVPVKNQSYRIMLRIADAEHMTTDEIEDQGNTIAENFGIAKGDVSVNTDYLWAYYVDPSFYAGIIVIILIVVFAGVLTIYSIYYVSMIHKVQEYGKLKALGATKRQIRQIVFREGMLVTGVAIPIGLLLAMLLSSSCFWYFIEHMSDTNSYSQVMYRIFKEGTVSIHQPGIVILSVGISLLTVCISLLKPMLMAGKITAIEAMRYENARNTKSKVRNGYINLSLLQLTLTNLSSNKKRTVITVITLGLTGILFLVTATILRCARPSEVAREEILADYRISIDSESGNPMHPERDWMNIQQDNPLDEAYEQQLRNIPGVIDVDKMLMASVQLEDYHYYEDLWQDSIVGLEDEFIDILEDSQIDGSVSYQELLLGEKILVSKNFLHWFPSIKVGDKIVMNLENGNISLRKEFIIGAVCDLPYAITQGSSFLLPSGVLEEICSNNMTYRYEIKAEKSNTQLKDALQVMVDAKDHVILESYKEKVKLWEDTMGIISKAGYTLIMILAGIGVMNLINTMINSVYIRRKELGILQAVGMSDRQLLHMLQLEGLFYTASTLIMTFSLGNIASYAVFRYAKDNSLFNITRYHYPLVESFLLVLTILLIQIVLTLIISWSLKKQSLMDRIRFSE